MGMAPFARRELIEKADELVRFSNSVFSNKRVEILRKAAKMYRDATLSVLADKTEKEADDWDILTG
jgi:hypothetical protein